MPGGGHVNCRRLPLSRDTAQRAFGWPGSERISMTNALLSGLQHGRLNVLALRSVRVAPPRGEINSSVYPVPSECRYAIQRPSGDHAGKSSSPGSLVSLKVWLDPGCRM